MTPPRILFVNQAAVLSGGELSLRDIARHFRTGSRVVLFNDGPFRTMLERDGVAVELLSAGASLMGVKRKGGSVPAGILWSLAKLSAQVAWRSRRYDLLYANSQKAFMVSALAGIMARRKVIWHLRDILDSDHFSSANIKAAVLLANLCAARVIANSRATADAFVRAGGQTRRVVVVHNGIDSGPFRPLEPAEVEAIRARVGLGRAPLLGVFGRLHPWKGQHVAVEALAQLPGAHLMVVGDALFGEEDYRAELQALATRLGVAPRIHWLGFREDIPELMAASDIVLHTSVAPEPFGRVIVEAMLARRPVVATLGGGAEEIIQTPETGVLVPPGDAIALADAVLGLLDRPDRRLAMGLAGRARAETMFGLATMLEEIEREVAAAVASR